MDNNFDFESLKGNCRGELNIKGGVTEED